VFNELVMPDVLFIDKSLLIKQIMDDKAKAILFTRPRRWGKTLNMSMLQHFFSPRAYGQETRGLFNHLKIAQEDGGKYMAHQGQYPVIFISLKDALGTSFEDTYARIKLLISELFNQHRELSASDRCSSFIRTRYKTILAEEATQAYIERSLAILSQCLWEHYGQKVYILIDEYDAPLNHAYNQEWFGQLTTFMRNFLSAGLKDNPYLEKGIMTGILRIAKADILSGLNNLSEQTLLDEGYAPYFGFTEEEIIELCNPSGEDSPHIKGSIKDIRDWYNGYSIGNLIIYNPWSIMNFLAKKGRLELYWIGSGERNQLIVDTLTHAKPAIKHQLEQLIQGKTIEIILNKFTTFEQLTTEATAFWNLLFNTGYLTVVDQKQHEQANLYICRVRIPNREVASFYIGTFKISIKHTAELSENYNRFISALITGDVKRFEKELRQFLINSFSYFDVGGKKPERVYHAFMLGLIADLRQTYIIKSNRESGVGRYDVLLLPNDKSALGIIFEFKSIGQRSTTEVLERSAQDALQQISRSQYESELDQHKVTNRLFVAIAFAGKRLSLYHKIELADFDPAVHLKAYQSSQETFTWTTPALAKPSFGYKIFGDIVGVAKTVTGNFNGEELVFNVYCTGGGGHCGFYSLPIPYDRAGVVALLSSNSGNPRTRELVMPEIIEVLKSGHLPQVMLDGYPQFAEFTAYQNAMDQKQAALLTSILDNIDPDRNLIPDRQFEKVMEYLRTSIHPDAKTQLSRMIEFQTQYHVKLNEFRIFSQSEEIFKLFVEHYIGGEGQLSFSIGGIDFTRETSFLDAVIELMDPPISLYIWETISDNPNRVKNIYRGGRMDAPPTHIYHERGRETHFALMSEGKELVAQGAAVKRKPIGDPPHPQQRRTGTLFDYFKRARVTPKPDDTATAAMDLDISNCSDPLI
jgi:hypothetical protein